MTKVAALSVRLQPDERRRLERLASRAGLTPSETVRQVLRMVSDVETVVKFDHSAGSSQANGAVATKQTA